MLFSNALEPVTDTALLLCTAVESVCAPFILYLALFHSKQMTRYRFLIINNVVWSCLYNWAVCLVKPAFMFPAMCFILDSPLVHRSFWTKVATILTMGFFINIEFSVFWCLMYRYCIAYPSLTDFVENSKTVFVVIIVTHCVAYTCAGGPFLLHPIRSSPDQSIERIRLLDQLPHFGEKEPYIGYICAPNIFLARLYCGLGAVFLVGWGICCSFLLFRMYYRVLVIFPKQGIMESTQKMHMILFKAVAVQLLVFLLFILFPTSLLMIAVVARWDEGTTLAAGCMLLVQMHGCVDFVTMIYFITPYRKKLLEIVGRPSKFSAELELNLFEKHLLISWSSQLPLMIYVNELEFLTRFILPFATIVELVCAPLMVYLVLFHSRQMKRYRFFILNSVLWNFLTNMLFCFGAPVIMLPSSCYIMRTAIFTHPYVALAHWSFLATFIGHTNFAVVWSLFYRYFMGFFGWPARLAESVWFMPLLALLTYVACTPLLYPLIIYPIPDAPRIKELFRQQLPHLQEYESQMSYACVPNSDASRFFILIVIVLFVTFLIMGIVLYGIMLHRIYITNPHDALFRTTTRLHNMLVKAFGVQLFVGYVFLCLPCMAMFIAFYAQWEEGTTICAFSFAMLQLHGSADFVTMMYFITPYRKKLMEILWRKYAIGSPPTSFAKTKSVVSAIRRR